MPHSGTSAESPGGSLAPGGPISWREWSRAAAAEAKEKAERAAAAASKRADAWFAADERRQRAKAQNDRLLGKAQAAGADVRDRAEHELGRLGATAGGKRVGAVVRRVGAEAGRLPGITILGDTFTHRHGVDVLLTRFREDPTDPERAVWLAEALRRSERDRWVWRAARTVVDPSTLVVRSAMGAAATLGADADRRRPSERVLRHGFHHAVRRVRSDARDAGALHTLARIYLSRGHPAVARELAGLAAMAAPDDAGLALVTAAHAAAASGAAEDARSLATAAVDHGCSLGWAVLSRLVDEESDTAARVAERARLLALVTDEDRVRYHGVVRSAGSTVAAVASTQKNRAVDTGERLRAAAPIPRPGPGAAT